MGFLTTNWSRSASVDSKLEVQNRELDTSLVEAVPVRLDNVNDGLSNIRCNIRPNDKVLGEFG